MIEKNVKKVKAKANRIWYKMNTGTRSHKSSKYPTREMNKANFKKELDNYWD